MPGDIGQEICDISKHHKEKMKEIIKFKAIPGLVPKGIHASLMDNNDQELFYNLCLGIQEGHLDPKWTVKPPGRINMARWLTTGTE